MRGGRVILAIEQTLLLGAVGTAILLNVESALGLTIVSRLPVYRVQVLRWAVERTAGAAAVTFSPALFDDGAGAAPLQQIDTMGVGLAVARTIRTPPAPVIANCPLGVLALLIAPNAAGDTFKVRAVVELLQ